MPENTESRSSRPELHIPGFRNVSEPGWPASEIAAYVVRELGLKRGAVWIDTAVDFSIAVTEYFMDALDHYGGETVLEDYFELSMKDFSSMAICLKEYQDRGEVDFVYVGPVPDNCGLVARQLRESGVTIPIFGEDGFDTPLLVEIGGEAAEGVAFATHVSLEDPDETVRKFLSDYESMFGIVPGNAFAALGYDALGLVAKAIELAGSGSPAKIPEGLAQISYFEGVSGIISYNDGSKIPDKSVSIIQVENGEFRTVKQMIPEYLPGPAIAE